MSMVYWAYPIDSTSTVDDGTIDALYEAIRATQRAIDAEISYDPGDAFSVLPGSRVTNQIRQVNETALDQADMVVAFSPHGVPSFGVAAEITQAALSGKPVLVITNKKSWAMPQDEPNVRIVVSVDWQAWGGIPEQSVQDGLAWLQEAAREQAAAGTGGGLLLWRKYPPASGEGVGGSAAPSRAYPDDAGWDLTVAEDVTIAPHSFQDVHLGVAVQLPSWSWGLLTGRSSTLRKRGLLVAQGVIDPGYRGPLFAGVWNLSDHVVRVQKGERIAQLIVVANGTLLTEAQEAKSLSDHPRGSNGFGSSGA